MCWPDGSTASAISASSPELPNEPESWRCAGKPLGRRPAGQQQIRPAGLTAIVRALNGQSLGAKAPTAIPAIHGLGDQICISGAQNLAQPGPETMTPGISVLIGNGSSAQGGMRGDACARGPPRTSPEKGPRADKSRL